MRTYWELMCAEQTCVGPIFARQTSAPQTWLTADEMRGGLGLKGPANVTRELAPTWQLDGLVFGRGGRSVGGRAAHEPGRAARVFRPCDPDGGDVQGRV